MVNKNRKVITLTTDFGTDNWFVGTIKGVIKSIAPESEIVDICHEIRPYNVREAAFVLLNAYQYFPQGTAHIVVIDPEVGTERKGIAICSSRYSFVGPDNGVLSYVLEAEDDSIAVILQNESLMLSPVSDTFHGRDIFAPAAAYLARGVDPGQFGPRIDNPVRLSRSIPGKIGSKELVGHVIYIDRFGNCITDITRADLEELTGNKPLKRFSIKIRDEVVRKLTTTYAESAGRELICLFGSSGYLEFGIYKGNASEKHNIIEGEEFILKAL